MTLRIIVVDDDLTTLTILRKLLGAEGFDVHATQEPREALELLERNAFDVLLTDLVMADMDGLALVKAARGLQPGLRCLVMSGHAADSTVPSNVRWITKPLDVDHLLDQLESA